jgi:L-ascorbate metabolism protein UlaG (beta-lactamase superfamily)
VLALAYLKPKIVIPCHYNTWPLVAVDVNAWADKVRAETSATPLVLTVDESHTL